jgi:hypothetical protein
LLALGWLLDALAMHLDFVIAAFKRANANFLSAKRLQCSCGRLIDRDGKLGLRDELVQPRPRLLPPLAIHASRIAADALELWPGRGRAQPPVRRNQTAYDPWHYVPVLARKPGALRNGAPFEEAAPGLDRTRLPQLKVTDDGDRQMIKILTAVLTDGLQAVEAACA